MDIFIDPNLKLYQITNITTDQMRFIADYNRQSACDSLGWDFKLCQVIEFSGKHSKSQYPIPQAELTIPCHICSFQYAECQKPTLKLCPVQLECPDLASWMEQAQTAHKCPHRGQELSAFDYHYHQRRVSTPNIGHPLTPRVFGMSLNSPPLA